MTAGRLRCSFAGMDLPEPIRPERGSPAARQAFAQQNATPGPLTVCPRCGDAEHMVTLRLPTISIQQAAAARIDPTDDAVKAINDFATNNDLVICGACGYVAYVPNSDPGIHFGGHKVRFTSFRCEDCDVSFDRLEDLSEHYRIEHPFIESHGLDREVVTDAGEQVVVICECGSTFASKAELEAHMRGIEAEIKKSLRGDG